jgi:general secretion pathway protein E
MREGSEKMNREPDLFIASGRNDADAAAVLNNLFLEAARLLAADVFFHYQDHHCRVRFRLPGDRMEPVMEIQPVMAKQIDEKIRSRAQLSVNDHRSPLDGRMRLRYPDHRLDIRVAITPGLGGQLIVCRLLDQANASLRLEEIEMSEMVRDCILQIIEEPNGLFLVTGPTGSGKTTTLYAILNELNDDTRNIITLENPVEYVVQGLHQINVDHVHITFAQALRAVLRQSPDVIMVGEIRDGETAHIAVEAALTGHLVLATMHTNNSALAITRLVELGVDPMTLAAALRGVSAQRLVRRITTGVAPELEMRPPNDVEQGWLALHGILGRNLRFPRAGRENYEGYVPLMEMIVADSQVRRSVNHGAVAIYNAAARQSQFETLAQAGARMAAHGITSLDEVRRVTSTIDAVQVQVKRIGQVLVEMGALDNQQLHMAVAKQTQLRRQGQLKQLGEILVEDGLCQKEDIIEALGHSADAPFILNKLVELGVTSEDGCKDLVSAWQSQPGGSLFELAVETGICTKEDIHEAAGLSA